MADGEVAPSAPTALVVTPGGLGETFLPILGPGSSVLRGAHRGTAGVDFVLTSDERVLEKLRLAPHTLPVIGVMALVARTSPGSLDELRDAVHHSPHWDGALDLWRRWRSIASTARPVFRATAVREEGLSKPHINEIARATAAGVSRAFPHWGVDMAAFNLEVAIVWLSTGAVVALPLTPGWHACARAARGSFFPVEEGGGGGGSERRGAPQQPILRPSVCHGLLRLAGVTATDLACDPVCGVGSIPAEALRRFGSVYCLGGDSGRSAVRSTAQRARRGHAPVVAALSVKSRAIGDGGGVRVHLSLSTTRSPILEVARWDVRSLPLRAGVLDVIVADLPWGNRGKAPPELLRDATREFERVLASGGTAVVLTLRYSAAQIEHALAEDPAVGGDARLRVVQVVDVCVGGWPVSAVKMRKEALGERAQLMGTPVADVTDAAATGSAAQHAARQAVSSPCCCAVDVTAELAPLSVCALLMAAFPSVVPNQSTARRAVRHMRACIASAPEKLLWWREPLPLGERLILRPHTDKYLPSDVLHGLHAADPLRVLWETEAWLCAVKPAGVDVARGKRSLANALLGLQLHRREPTDGDERASQSVPWTAAYAGACRVGGAWLVAKGALSAVALLDGAVSVQLEWRAIFVGAPSAAALSRYGLDNVEVLRANRSIRYGTLTEATFRTDHKNTEAWRDAAAAGGHPVVGDRPHSEGPTACFWVSAVHVHASDDPRVRHLSASGPAAAAPERFARLFEREEAMCERVDAGAGAITSEYVKRLLQVRQAEGAERAG